jgi:urease accessory protein
MRQRRRFDATDRRAASIGVLSAARRPRVRGGDVLVVEDGSLLQVLAAPQPVLQHHRTARSTARRST